MLIQYRVYYSLIVFTASGTQEMQNRRQEEQEPEIYAEVSILR